ncbi:suppressor protein SRP40 [Heracleum sosnowskyi]|uniref:Suppressor protein SRP40 n=1 Tax=Heracleum sosnowskyi TaxID=360622 RepID=A0AAD8NCK6_9APIA|nr:suppressor protein SRP40 [Heracleum sosnowskyi]
MSSIVTYGSNVAAKQSAKKVEGDDGIKTVECLRGRLLSERVASKAANEEADILGNKLVELENKLKEEVKRRNRAQERLKSLEKKLESLKIVYVVSDESSSHSTSLKKIELSVVLSSSSSTVSSFSYPSTQPEENDMGKPNSQMRKSSECEFDEPSEILIHTDIDNASSEYQSFSSNEKVSCDKTISEISYDDLQCAKFRDDAEHDDHRSKSADKDRETCGQNHPDRDETIVDISMALVPVDIPATTPATITKNEPLIIYNARVEEVLDTLRNVKERLQSSMERRRMIRVGL